MCTTTWAQKYPTVTSSSTTCNSKYHYEPEDLGCFKFHYDCVYIYGRQDRTNKYPATCVPLPSTLEDSVDVKFLVVTPNIYET